MNFFAAVAVYFVLVQGILADVDEDMTSFQVFFNDTGLTTAQIDQLEQIVMDDTNATIQQANLTEFLAPFSSATRALLCAKVTEMLKMLPLIEQLAFDVRDAYTAVIKTRQQKNKLAKETVKLLNGKQDFTKFYKLARNLVPKGEWKAADAKAKAAVVTFQAKYPDFTGYINAFAGKSYKLI